jgi:hypothetical protein
MPRQSKAVREHDTRLSFFSEFASADLDDLDLDFDTGKRVSPGQARAMQLVSWFFRAVYHGDLRAYVGPQVLMAALTMGTEPGSELVAFMRDVQPVFKKYFDSVVEAVIEGRKLGFELEINAIIRGGMGDDVFRYTMAPAAGYGNLLDRLSPEVEEARKEQAANFLLMALFKELQGINRSGFKTCPQCGGYFVLASETAQVYCSKRCSDAKRGADYRARQKKGGDR